MFKERLREAMEELNLSQVQVARMTGKSKGSVSQYLAGNQTPPRKTRQEIAKVLGLPEDYFDTEEEQLLDGTHIKRMKPQTAAKLMGIGYVTLLKGLRQGTFPWGYAIKTGNKRWTYYVNAAKFLEIEKIKEETI